MSWGDNDFEDNSGFDNARAGFDHPRTHHYGFLDSDFVYWLILVVVVTVCALVAACMLGRHRGGKKLKDMRVNSVSYIYDHIKYHIDLTLKSQGAAMIDHARELVAVVQGRLSAVIAIDAEQGKLIKALDKALKGEGEVEKPKSNKIKTGMSVDEQRLAIWKAVHGFSEFWKDRKTVHCLLEKAQIELFQTVDNQNFRLELAGLELDPKPDPEPTQPSPPPVEKKLKGKPAKTKKNWLRAAKAQRLAEAKAAAKEAGE